MPATPPPPTHTTDVLPILVAQKVLTAEQAERVRRTIKLNNVPAEQAVIQLGIANEVQIAQAVAAHAGLPYVKINPLDLDLDVVTKGIAGPFARKHGMVALSKTDDTITVAVYDPFAPFPEEDIKRVTGLNVTRVVATRTDVETVNKGFYDLKTSLTTAEKQLTQSRIVTVDLGNQEFLSGESKELDPAAAPVVKALDHILSYAFEQRASDIHFEPKRDLTLVRLRIDGILHDVHLIPRIVYQAVVSRIKLLSGANLAEKRRPQDGRIKREQGGREIELRVSTMPTAFGEKAVLRIFDPDILLKGIDELGLSGRDVPKFYDFIGRPTGIILVTGPTGSGKTTTLYSVLKHLSKPEVNIVTIEDPIEMVFEDFNQEAVRPQIDITFASALRTVLRQDPDIIMVGEIRDLATAEMAIQAALTGHLVFSTLHTNDAASAVTRLIDLGVPPYLIGATVIGVLAQRLVRTLCPSCKQPDADASAELIDEAVKPWRLKGEFRPCKPVGCLECRHTGFRGRGGLYELLVLDDALQGAIHPHYDGAALRKRAAQQGLQPLRLAGAMKVAQGQTTLDEVLRATPRWE